MQEEHKPITINSKQAAAMLGISYWQILEMAKRGEIPYIPVGKKRLFREEALLRWLIEREQSTVTKQT